MGTTNTTVKGTCHNCKTLHIASDNIKLYNYNIAIYYYNRCQKFTSADLQNCAATLPQLFIIHIKR